MHMSCPSRTSSLERYRLNELPAAEAARVTARLEQDDDAPASGSSALEASDEELRPRIVPDWLAARHRRALAAAGDEKRRRAAL